MVLTIRYFTVRMILMIWLIEDVLNAGDIRYISDGWSPDKFHCGSDSNPNKLIKKNWAMNYDDPDHNDYVKFFYSRWQKASVDYLIKRCGQPYFAWYQPGHFYDWHLDSFPISGIAPHYSYTCFLNEDYEGGELVIRVGNTEREFKPKKGSIVLYNTGLWHKVNRVTAGDRKVVIGWAESFIKDSRMRENIIDFKMAVNAVADDISHDQLQQLESVRINIIREVADV